MLGDNMNKEYNRVLKDLRIDRDLSQEDIASILGYTKQNYSQIESGRILLSIKDLVALANFYNVNTDYILGLNDNKESSTKKYIYNKGFIAEKLKECRVVRDISQKYISDTILNTSQSVYSRIENAEYELNIINFIKLLKYYEVSSDMFLKIN